MPDLLRQARREDIPALHRVRLAVRENVLTSTSVTEAAYVEAIERTGRGFLIEVAGEIVGFAVGNAETGNVWALFVHPDHERRGYGRRLHDALMTWFGERGVERLWLDTEAGTRAQGFYEAAGWQRVGPLSGREQRYERSTGEPVV